MPSFLRTQYTRRQVLAAEISSRFSERKVTSLGHIPRDCKARSPSALLQWSTCRRWPESAYALTWQLTSSQSSRKAQASLLCGDLLIQKSGNYTGLRPLAGVFIAGVCHCPSPAFSKLTELAEDKRRFLKHVEEFCTRVNNDWHRVYLVRKLSSQRGMEFVQSFSKQGHPCQWVFPRKVIAQQVRNRVLGTKGMLLTVLFAASCS
jgi:hypothetical protein